MALTKNVSEPWFSLIALRKKTVEGRLRKGDFADVAPGQRFVWTNDELGFERSFKTTVKSVKEYATFRAYLSGEGLARCLPAPGVTSVRKGVEVYRRFYDAKTEREHGVVAAFRIAAWRKPSASRMLACSWSASITAPVL